MIVDTETHKTCFTCKVEKPIEDFSITNRSGRGPIRRGSCKPCTNAYKREARKRERDAQAALQKIKKEQQKEVVVMDVPMTKLERDRRLRAVEGMW